MWGGAAWCRQEPGGHEVEEAYICLKGSGYIYLNGKKQIFEPGTWVWLPPWTEHGIDNTGIETCARAPVP
jgi:quercetin dioxygenase-like cupin family protein